LTAKKINSKAVARLESLLKKQRQIVEDQDVVEYSKSDFEFHGIIYDSCGNWLLRQLLENIKNRSRPFVCDITAILLEFYQDHIEVVEAFKNHDSARVKKVMHKHNARMRRRIERIQRKQ